MPTEYTVTDERALDLIATLLRDTEDWSADTLEAIAEWVTWTGRKVSDHNAY